MSVARARRIVLGGPPAVGKSTVGAALAASLGWQFIDLDRALEAAHGRAISTWFAESGEASFRAAERAMLDSLLSGTERVIAVGGGALTDTAWRHTVLTRARVFGLSAPLPTLVSRAAREGHRPLVSDDPARQLAALLSAREEGYAEVDATVENSGSVASAAAALAGLNDALGDSLVVPLGRRSYPISFGPAASFASHLARGGGPSRRVGLVVTDTTVAVAQARALDALCRAWGAESLRLEAGEAHKQLAALGPVWSTLLRLGVDRQGLVAALGGGVVSDMVGLAAALYLRGIDYVSVPTTLLAMADAAVGGKTAVDLAEGKNLIGAFHHPRAVCVDVDTLDTLSAGEYRAGLAEVLKVGVVVDPGLLDFCEAHAAALAVAPRAAGWAEARALRVEVIRGAIAAKIAVVAADEREAGLRAVLNFGHTLGHAVEQASGYALRHGEAVGFGMRAALDLGVRLGITPAELRQRVVGTLRAMRLGASPGVDYDLAWKALFHDKKRDSQGLRFVLAEAPGRARLRHVDAPEVADVFRAALENG
ncbi:MAG: 3-dehydroquinate synthase [Myxococcales bacterium]|nr:3-dehydroquinate synthase [Myxococcales bacterium]